MIVVDASAAVSALLNAGPARRALASGQLHVPHLIDPEIANAVRGRVSAGALPVSTGWLVLESWRRMGMTRYAAFSMLDRIWQLRDNLTAYDASYVALAELLGCALLTADGRIGCAPGVRCAVTVVPA
ncbi:MAG: type II toxin-antitoxin system VapC family toxin [Solirubrobacteraceae bacterium]